MTYGRHLVISDEWIMGMGYYSVLSAEGGLACPLYILLYIHQCFLECSPETICKRIPWDLLKIQPPRPYPSHSDHIFWGWRWKAAFLTPYYIKIWQPLFNVLLLATISQGSSILLLICYKLKRNLIFLFGKFNVFKDFKGFLRADGSFMSFLGCKM